MTVVAAYGTELTAAGTGPRITGFRRHGDADLFARLPDSVALEWPGGPPFVFGGGHRLWVSPEVAEITYAPDEHPVETVNGASTVTLTAPPDAAGVAKSITATITGPGTARIEHTVTNASDRPLTVAPWAITQLRTGGTALLPLGRGEVPHAEHSLVLWPYTRLDDPLLSFSRHLVTLTARRVDQTKVGTALTRGWMAYALEGIALVKRIDPPGAAAFTDLGATGQVYCNDMFLELETLGPLVTLAPGESAHHGETWELHDVPDGTAPAELALRFDAPEEAP